MRKLFTMIALSFGLTAAATTADAYISYGEDLRFVAETNVPNANGVGKVALCHLVDFASLVSLPVYTSVNSYVLSSDQCTGANYSELSLDNFAVMQTAGLIPADIPAIAKADLQSLIMGNALLILGVVAVIFKLLFSALNRGGVSRKAKAPDALAIHSLVAMSQVAIADGKIDAAEIRHIAQILTRLTGRAYDPEQVTELLNRLNPSASDLEQVGQDLSEKDRQIVLEAALNIAVADGEIHANEYAVVSDLAQHMRIGADQFRSAMARISAHLQTMNPA